MAARSNQRRAERALADFKHRLESLDAEAVRALLAQRRVRSPERVAMAQARLAELEHAEQPTEAAPLSGSQVAAEPAARPNGQDQAKERAAKREEAAAAIAAGAEVPLARQIGRVLGIGLGIASIAALALFIVRR